MASVNKQKLIAVVGPTSSGKSGLAMKLAPKFEGEIVIADSRQIYKDLTIGTSKPTPEEQKLVPHHLVDVVLPGNDFSVAKYKELATKTITDIHSRDKLPLLVGGTGLYIDAITQGLDIPEVPPNEDLRAKLEEKPLHELVTELERLDPKFAKQVDTKNKCRLVRAIEVCRATGKKFSDLRKKQPVPYVILYLAIKWQREELYKRIDETVDLMMKFGFKDEIKGLLSSGISPDWLHRLGLEYRFITPVVQGTEKETKAVQNLKFASHQYAKRQLTWFRKNKSIHWLTPTDAETKSRNLLKKF